MLSSNLPLFSRFFFVSILVFSSPARSEPVPPLLRLPSSDGVPGDVCAHSPPSKPKACPISCFRPDPVCGADGVTYWCGCADAACSGVPVAKMGFCEVGNGGGEGLLSGQGLLLVHIVWLVVLGFSFLFGVF